MLSPSRAFEGAFAKARVTGLRAIVPQSGLSAPHGSRAPVAEQRSLAPNAAGAPSTAVFMLPALAPPDRARPGHAGSALSGDTTAMPGAPTRANGILSGITARGDRVERQRGRVQLEHPPTSIGATQNSHHLQQVGFMPHVQHGGYRLAPPSSTLMQQQRVLRQSQQQEYMEQYAQAPASLDQNENVDSSRLERSSDPRASYGLQHELRAISSPEHVPQHPLQHLAPHLGYEHRQNHFEEAERLSTLHQSRSDTEQIQVGGRPHFNRGHGSLESAGQFGRPSSNQGSARRELGPVEDLHHGPLQRLDSIGGRSNGPYSQGLGVPDFGIPRSYHMASGRLEGQMEGASYAQSATELLNARGPNLAPHSAHYSGSQAIMLSEEQRNLNVPNGHQHQMMHYGSSAATGLSHQHLNAPPLRATATARQNFRELPRPFPPGLTGLGVPSLAVTVPSSTHHGQAIRFGHGGQAGSGADQIAPDDAAGWTNGGASPSWVHMDFHGPDPSVN
jgi:hypothetical protein